MVGGGTKMFLRSTGVSGDGRGVPLSGASAEEIAPLKSGIKSENNGRWGHVQGGRASRSSPSGVAVA
jgi:hypothetical protein